MNLSDYNPFRRVDADELAQHQLNEHKVALLEAQRSRDYFTKMVEYHESRVKALAARTSCRTVRQTQP